MIELARGYIGSTDDPLVLGMLFEPYLFGLVEGTAQLFDALLEFLGCVEEFETGGMQIKLLLCFVRLTTPAIVEGIVD